MAVSEYDWHPAPGGSTFKVESTRNLGWWVLLALLVSVILHVVLYIVLGGMSWIAGGSSDALDPIRINASKEQLIIDKDKLDALLPENKPIEPQEAPKPEKLSDMDTVQKLDEFDILDKIKDEPIRMSPVESPQVFLEAPKVQPKALVSNIAAMDMSAAKVMAQDMKEMREKLIDSSAVVSSAQPVMQVNSDALNTAFNTDDFFKDAAKKAFGEEGADKFMEGYNTLDGLIGNTGGRLPPGEEKILMPTDILFEYNEFQLKEEARLSMLKLAYIIQTNPDAEFIIEGHTDSFGGDEFNLSLSMKRAAAVRDYLIKKLQIGSENVRVIGLGKQRPIVPVEGTIEEQALNRRVEIVVKKK
ncbi:MAG: OmpA family protein [Verrucomicrobiales bacterium]|nr:OmpA family protein [Verrucomicrobiales bacterium]